MNEAVSAIAGDVLESGALTSTRDLNACRSVIRSTTPSWCWSHDEFPGICDEVICSAISGFDRVRGTFGARLQQRAQDRVARSLYRSVPAFERKQSPASLDLLSEAAGVDECLARPDIAFSEMEEWEAVMAFLGLLEGDDREVARRLATGESQAEIAGALGISPRAVSRTVQRIRPLAAKHFATGRSHSVAA
jgi:Homeodomain-like domain